MSAGAFTLNRSEGLPHALFFPGRDWSGVWLRLDARRLAVPKEARFGPPPFWWSEKFPSEKCLKWVYMVPYEFILRESELAWGRMCLIWLKGVWEVVLY